MVGIPYDINVLDYMDYMDIKKYFHINPIIIHIIVLTYIVNGYYSTIAYMSYLPCHSFSPPPMASISITQSSIAFHGDEGNHESKSQKI
jgi:hypothetical protein